MKWFNFAITTKANYELVKPVCSFDALGDPLFNTNNPSIRNFIFKKDVVIAAFFWECSTLDSNIEFCQIY